MFSQIGDKSGWVGLDSKGCRGWLSYHIDREFVEARVQQLEIIGAGLTTEIDMRVDTMAELHSMRTARCRASGVVCNTL